MNFLWLAFAHYVGDTGLQNGYTIKYKKVYWYILFSHCVVYTGCIAVALNYLGILSLWKLAFILLGHYLIDSYKFLLPKRLRDLIDQLLHFIQLAIVYFL